MSSSFSQLQQIPQGSVHSACLHAAAEGLQSAIRLLGLDDEGTVVSAPAVFAEDADMVCIAFDTTGGAEGTLVLLMTEKEALDVAHLLLNRFSGPKVSTLNSLAQNALSEIGNILASSFLNHLSGLVHTSCLPSVPALLLGSSREVWDRSFAKMGTAHWTSFSLGIGSTTLWLLFRPSEKTSLSLSASVVSAP
ncbi:MAG: hypothetical protein GY822_29675 [Deltaproteobacteria bacterium]|nr:hypothetical protein [Deltaproteobacteria bacterium]